MMCARPPLIECYNPLHPLTRTGVREQRLKIMQVAIRAGAVLGAEGPPQDWNVQAVDFYDESGARFGIEVPLWGLVYHDSAMLYRQHATPYNYGMDNYGYSRGPWPAKFLRGILYGDQSSWTVSNAAYWAWRKTFKQINDVLAPLQRRLAFDQMTGHARFPGAANQLLIGCRGHRELWRVPVQTGRRRGPGRARLSGERQ